MKHLRLLEGAGLVVTRRSVREKLHFLNPLPIRLIHDRWIDKYAERGTTTKTKPKWTTKYGYAPLVAGERESEGAGGGWNEILSSLKTLLETGVRLPFHNHHRRYSVLHVTLLATPPQPLDAGCGELTMTPTRQISK